MEYKYMDFGEYIKTLRKSRGLTGQQVADYLDVVKSYISAIENKIKAPFDEEKMILFAESLNLTEEETALLYDLASKYNGNVPHDIRGIFMHEPVGELARTALRLSKSSQKTEAKWKRLIRELQEENDILDDSEGGDES